MRIVSLLLVLSSLPIISAQEAKKEEQQGIPTTLSEAHAELERILSSEELAEIDAMASKYDMSKYHFGLGLSIRNNWGLWQGSALAKHMRELGFTDPDDMSAVILETFWCKRHGQNFRLKERAAASKKSIEAAKKWQEEQETRVQRANTAIRNVMMGLRFEKRDVPVVRIPTQRGLSVRSMYPFRNGVFLTAYCQGSILSDRYTVTSGPNTGSAGGETRSRPKAADRAARGFYWADGELRKLKPGEDFYTVGFYLDLKDRRVHRIRVAEVSDVYATVVAGGGNMHLNVSQEKIWWYWPGNEEQRLREKICAFTITHEMGHVLLGLLEGQHIDGSTENVMTDSIQHVLPRLRTCEWPVFNTEQTQKIRSYYRQD